MVGEAISEQGMGGGGTWILFLNSGGTQGENNMSCFSFDKFNFLVIRLIEIRSAILKTRKFARS